MPTTTLYVVRKEDIITHQGYSLTEALKHITSGYIEHYQGRELIGTTKVANGRVVIKKVDNNPFGLRS